MDDHQRARALAVDVEIADMELALGAGDTVAVGREERAGQAVLRVVGDGQRLVKVLRLDDRQHRPKNLFLRQPRRGRDIGDDGRRDEIALLAGWLAAYSDLALILANLDVLLNLLVGVLVYHRADRIRLVRRVAD